MNFQRDACATAKAKAKAETETADQAQPMHPLADRLNELLTNPAAATFGDLARVVEAISGELSFAPAIAACDQGPGGTPAHDVRRDDPAPAAPQAALGA